MAELKDVLIFPDADTITAAAADEVLRRAAAAVRERGRFAWALSGGSTPRALYRSLAGPPYRERMPWSATHVFWGDERHVPPDHADSNFRMAREAMIDAAPLPPDNVHRIRAEEPADAAAKAYEAELRAFFALAPGEWPRFDLVLLGLGKDAHTASLFPGGEAVRETHRLVVAPWIESQKTERITFTPPVLNHARLAMFLVSGEDKAEALRAVLEGERDPMRFPAQVVSGSRLWMVDEAAARLLGTAA